MQIIEQFSQRQTRDTGSDNDNRSIGFCCRFGNIAAQWLKAHLLAHHWRVFGRHFLGQAVRHHTVKGGNIRVGQFCCRLTAQYFQRGISYLVLQFG